jgi:hypothetical protein
MFFTSKELALIDVNIPLKKRWYQATQATL